MPCLLTVNILGKKKGTGYFFIEIVKDAGLNGVKEMGIGGDGGPETIYFHLKAYRGIMSIEPGYCHEV